MDGLQDELVPVRVGDSELHPVCAALPFHCPAERAAIRWRHIAWLLPWFGGMWVLSALGDVGGGTSVLGFWWSVVLVVLWSLFVMRMAVRTALSAEQTVAIMARMERTS